MSHIAIAIRPDLVTEIVLRSEGRVDVAGLIESVLSDFLDRTRGDAVVWSETHAASVGQAAADDEVRRVGNPNKGYFWQHVFLPNGTQLKATYKGEDYFAAVEHQNVVYHGDVVSPSIFARKIANNTNRNAWRDIWVKRPQDQDFIFAEVLRMAKGQA